ILAILVGLAALTGLLALRSGSAGWAWGFVLHGLGATALAVLIGGQLARGLPRAGRARRWTRRAGPLLVTSPRGVGPGRRVGAGGGRRDPLGRAVDADELACRRRPRPPAAARRPPRAEALAPASAGGARRGASR